jgi:hypothetical protein
VDHSFSHIVFYDGSGGHVGVAGCGFFVIELSLPKPPRSLSRPVPEPPRSLSLSKGAGVTLIPTDLEIALARLTTNFLSFCSKSTLRVSSQGEESGFIPLKARFFGRFAPSEQL